MNAPCSLIPARVRRVVDQLAGPGRYCLDDSQRLHEDIDLDSLDRIQLAMKLEDEFSIQLSDDEVDDPKLATVGGLIQHVEAKVAARADKFQAFHENVDRFAGSINEHLSRGVSFGSPKIA